LPAAPPPDPELWPADDEVVEPPELPRLLDTDELPAAVPPLPDFPPPPASASEDVLPLQASERPKRLKIRESAVCRVIASPWCGSAGWPSVWVATAPQLHGPDLQELRFSNHQALLSFSVLHDKEREKTAPRK
jgi:hypothetical protein